MAEGTCGTGGWTGPLPGDPDTTNISLSAVTAYGGIRVSWSYPIVNANAVAHTLLYRGISANFANAIQLAVAAGSSFFDAIHVETATQYYYWIKVVSVNGTVGNLIGPASAQAVPLSEQTLESLSGLINEGVLAQSLRTEIGKVTFTYDELMAEIADRIAANSALGAALADVQSGLVDSITLLNQEIVTRMEGDSAFASVVNTIAAANATNLGLIQEERLVRVNADSALGLRIDFVSGNTDAAAALIETEHLAWVNADNALALQIEDVAVANTTGIAAAVKDISSTKLGYSALRGTSTPYDGNGTTVVYPVASYPTITYPEYATNRTRIIDNLGVSLWNATPAGITKPVDWHAGLPLATAIKQVGVSGPSGEYVSLEQSFIAQQTLNGEFKGMYTAEVDVNGLVGGFGIYNDGHSVQAGFIADMFYIGSTASNKVSPFIVDTVTNTVHMDNAVIRNADITTLKIAGNAVTVASQATEYSYHGYSGGTTLTSTPVDVCSTQVSIPYLGGGTAGTIITAYTTLYEGGGDAASIVSNIRVDGVVRATTACTLGESKTNTTVGYVELEPGTHTIDVTIHTGSPGAATKNLMCNAGIVIMSGKR